MQGVEGVERPSKADECIQNRELEFFNDLKALPEVLRSSSAVIPESVPDCLCRVCVSRVCFV